MDFPNGVLVSYQPTESQAQKTVPLNNLDAAASPAMLFGYNGLASAGLTWAFFGGEMLVAGTLTAIANNTVTLTASTTNYVEASETGVVSVNTTGFTTGRIPLYQVVTNATAPISWIDQRQALSLAPLGSTGIYVLAATRTSAVAATTAALPANTYSNGTSGVGATITGNANGALAAQDGITLTAGQKLLVKNEATAANNGHYALTQVGDGTHPYILTRTGELSQGAQFPGAEVYVETGTVFGNQLFFLNSAGPYTVGTTAVSWINLLGTPSSGQLLVGTANGTYAAQNQNTIPLSNWGAATANVSLSGFVIQNNGTPVNPNDAATKTYVDSLVQGIPGKFEAIAASTGALPAYTVGGGGATLTANANGAFPAQDGVTLTVNQLFLLLNGASQVDQGLWKLTTVGTGSAPWVLTRPTDVNDNWGVGVHAAGYYVFVNQGTVNGSNGFVCTAPVGSDVVGTNNLPFVQFTGAGEITVVAPIVKSGNQLSLATNGVTNAFLAQMAANTLKGNATGSTANAADLSPATVMGTGFLNLGGIAGQINASTIGVGAAPVSGTGLNIASIAQTGTNAYGLQVNAPTGATNNYSAKFIGSVGIGADPTAKFLVKDNTTGVGTSSFILDNSGTVANEAGISFYNSTISSSTASFLGGRIYNKFDANSFVSSRITIQNPNSSGVLQDVLSVVGAQVGIGTTTPTNILSLGGQVAQIFWMERNTTANTAGNSLTVQAGGATSAATNKVGGDIIFQPGMSTGNAVPALAHIKANALGTASGTADQSFIDRIIANASKVLTNNTVTSLVSCVIANGSVIAGQLHYAVEVTDGTDYQVEEGVVSFHETNKAGALANNTTVKAVNQQAATAGTLTVTFTITAANPALVQVNANSSLTPSTGFPRITYELKNLTQQAVTIQ